jgi:diacylglycerol kinase
MIRIKRLAKSFQYAVRGLLKVAEEEQNFRVELTVAAVVIIAALVLKVSRLDLIILILVSALVLIMEIINSAVEAISDALKPKLDIFVKRIKDIVAAGVMVAALTAVVVGCLIFSQYLY